jgi:predicted dehydrogenase
MSIRIAVAGLGGQGRNQMEAVRKMPPWEVVGGSDPSPQARAKAVEQLGVPVFATLEELLEKTKPDAVYVATSTFAHLEPTVTALQAGCSVILDKPMGVNLAEADQMVAAASASTGNLYVFHNRRGDGDFITLERLVKEGALGDLVLLQSRLMANAPQPAATPENWRADPARGGGMLLDWGPHLTDHVLALMSGKPVRVLGEVRTLSWTLPVENYFRIHLWFDDGGRAEVEYNNASPLELPRFYALGGKACALKLGMEGCVGIPSLIHTEFLVRDYETGRIDMVQSARPDHMLLWRNLAEVLQGQAEPLVPLDHAHRVMAVLDAARRSAESGEFVAL